MKAKSEYRRNVGITGGIGAVYTQLYDVSFEKITKNFSLRNPKICD